ncbi:MAG: hypothetical protein H0X65_14645 [Gemmatimonadetes bacterium]|jgi:hypothetical protein|nr:hypothetical protein [Gemmatimonadota bacterium]
MVTREDVESYLLRTELDHEEVEEGMWMLRAGPSGAGLVVSHTPPVLVFRVKVLDIPADPASCARLYRRLLELNATDLVHGAYGIEEGDIVLTETMELVNLEFNEFQATVESIQMALASHLDELAPYRTC